MDSHDTISTLAGGGAGLGMMATVRWELFPQPWGEAAKLAVAFSLIVVGYLMYRKRDQ